MRYLIILSCLVLAGAGCFTTTTETRTQTQYTSQPEPEIVAAPEAAGETLEQSWQRIDTAVRSNDCEAFGSMFVYTVTIEQADCDKYFAAHLQSPPPIDWTATIYKDVQKSDGEILHGAEVYMTNGVRLSTFYQEDDGIWRASTKFWK